MPPHPCVHSDQMAAGLCFKSTRGVKSEAGKPRMPAKHRDDGKDAGVLSLCYYDLNVNSFTP